MIPRCLVVERPQLRLADPRLERLAFQKGTPLIRNSDSPFPSTGGSVNCIVTGVAPSRTAA
jgi:hypothetical protein